MSSIMSMLRPPPGPGGPLPPPHGLMPGPVGGMPNLGPPGPLGPGGPGPGPEPEMPIPPDQAAMMHLMMAFTQEGDHSKGAGIVKGMGALQGILAGAQKAQAAGAPPPAL